MRLDKIAAPTSLAHGCTWTRLCPSLRAKAVLLLTQSTRVLQTAALHLFRDAAQAPVPHAALRGMR